MTKKFKAGDIVQLKSGGPKMTVRFYDQNFGGSESDDVLCEWFDAKAELKYAKFNQESLNLVDKES
jgi:uncharacterized protein YodC (DUF2158 family)